LLSNLRQQQSLKHDQYPKSIADVSNVLNNHKFDNLGRRGQEKSKENENKPKKDNNMDLPELSFAQLEGNCYCCGKPGHKSPKCNEKSKPKEEWYVNKVKKNNMQRQQTNINAEQRGEIDTSQSPVNHPTIPIETVNTINWAGTHVQFYQAQEMRGCILLDNESTASVFCNGKYLQDIKESDEELILSTNGGDLKTQN
jgi:hypothetical protein